MEDLKIEINITNAREDVKEIVEEMISDALNSTYFDFLEKGGREPYDAKWNIKSVAKKVREETADRDNIKQLSFMEDDDG